jgi:hypothetical protein
MASAANAAVSPEVPIDQTAIVGQVVHPRTAQPAQAVRRDSRAR